MKQLELSFAERDNLQQLIAEVIEDCGESVLEDDGVDADVCMDIANTILTQCFAAVEDVVLRVYLLANVDFGHAVNKLTKLLDHLPFVKVLYPIVEFKILSRYEATRYAKLARAVIFVERVEIIVNGQVWEPGAK